MAKLKAVEKINPIGRGFAEELLEIIEAMERGDVCSIVVAAQGRDRAPIKMAISYDSPLHALGLLDIAKDSIRRSMWRSD